MLECVPAQAGRSNHAKVIRATFPFTLALLCASAGAGPSISLSELMRLLASIEQSQARFVETKYSALLKSPLVLTGTLSYRRPDRVEKHVRSPYDERMILEGGRLTLEVSGEKKTFSVAAAPAAAALVESVRATLAGDLDALRQYYSLKLEGALTDWTLTLQPLDAPVQELVRSITLSGSRDQIRRVEVEEAGGDRSVMEITEHKA